MSNIDLKSINAIVKDSNNKDIRIIEHNNDLIWGNATTFPYQTLEYLDIPSGCYINLNDVGKSTLAYYLDVNWNINGDSFSGDGFPFGSIYYNGSNYYRYHLIISATNMRAAYGQSQFTALFDTADSNQRYLVELNYHSYGDKKAYVDNVDKGSFSPTILINVGNVYIGGRRFNNNGTVTINDYTPTIRVYSLKSKTSSTSGESVFYPVKRRSDGKLGLLKVYNQGESVTFCTTETSTEPIAGPVKNPYFTPSGFRKLEYIHFNGAEYTQTDFYPGTTTKNYEFAFSVDNKTDSMNVIGSYYGYNTADALRRWYIANINSNGIRCGIGNQWSSYSTNYSANDKLRVIATYSKSSSYPKLAWNLKNITTDTEIGSVSSLTATSTGDIQTSVALRIGCRISTNSSGTTNNEEYLKGNLYYFTKRNTNNTGTIEINYVPCQRKSDSVCGLFDTINKIFYPMQGTTITSGAAGPTVDEYWDLT